MDLNSFYPTFFCQYIIVQNSFYSFRFGLQIIFLAAISLRITGRMASHQFTKIHNLRSISSTLLPRDDRTGMRRINIAKTTRQLSSTTSFPTPPELSVPLLSFSSPKHSSFTSKNSSFTSTLNLPLSLSPPTTPSTTTSKYVNDLEQKWSPAYFPYPPTKFYPTYRCPICLHSPNTTYSDTPPETLHDTKDVTTQINKNTREVHLQYDKDFPPILTTTSTSSPSTTCTETLDYWKAATTQITKNNSNVQFVNYQWSLYNTKVVTTYGPYGPLLQDNLDDNTWIYIQILFFLNTVKTYLYAPCLNISEKI